MWILTPLQPGGETHYLSSGKEYTVGRKNCDILLPNDQSISRAHACLAVTDQSLNVKDISKYGTFINSQRLTENTPVDLKSGDNVTFGVFESKFSVDYQKPVVCSSCLDNDGKASLTQALLPLGGKLVNSWSHECTHLVMPSLKVTIKTITALLCCRPIVKPEFFLEFSKASQQKLPPPKVERFIPEIDEPSLTQEDVNLGPILVRKQLFSGMTFIFLSAKQHKRLSAAVSFGGGRSQALQEGSLPRDLLESPQSCVVDVMTGSSQPLLPSSSLEWADSVRNIVQRKGLRVITESEIGLAAIYASCDKYCNPSSVIADTVPNVKPSIPSATLSQNITVDETVLPAASQNITAYAANTETQSISQIGQSKPAAPKKITQCIVADSVMSSSFSTTENKDLRPEKKPESRLPASGRCGNGSGSQSPLPKTNDSMKTFPHKQSPQTRNISAQSSPQKQSTLTTFFQPAKKKRPLEDELSAVMSEPKRLVLESSINIQATDSAVASKEEPSLSDRAPAATSQSSVGSAADQILRGSVAPSDRVSQAAQGEPLSRKRKTLEKEIQMDELESIMSADMFCLDEQPFGSKGPQARTHSSVEPKQAFNAAEASSSSKRQRTFQEENTNNQRPRLDLKKEPSTKQNPKTEKHVISIKTEELDSSEFKTANYESSKAEAFADRNQNLQPFKDDVSFIEDLELLKGDICQLKEAADAPLKPIAIKLEVKEAEIDEDLPKRLTLVEFRSLTVNTNPKGKPRQALGNGHANNFKNFRKTRVPGTQGSPHVIGGPDLLVHNRGKNSDLDEWLKDAAEEEQQSRREEAIGDDLFRYNPTKLTKRR